MIFIKSLLILLLTYTPLIYTANTTTSSTSLKKKNDSIVTQIVSLLTEKSDICQTKTTFKTLNNKNKLESYLKSINYYRTQNDIESTLYYCDLFESALTKKITEEHKSLIKQYYLEKGIFLLEFGQSEQAINYYKTALTYIHQDSISSIVKVKLSIAKAYANTKKYDNALTTIKSHIKDTSLLPNDLKIKLINELAYIYQSKKEPKESSLLNNTALSLIKNQNSPGKWRIKNRIAYDYYLLGNYKQAIDSALIVRKNFTLKKMKKDLAINSEFLSLFYNDYGDLNNAIKYSKDAIKKSEIQTSLPDLYKNLIILYLKKHDHIAIMETCKQREEVIDNIRDLEKSLFITYSAANFKLTKEKIINDQIRTQNQLLETENKRQKLQKLAMCVMLISVISLLLLAYIYKEYRNGTKEISVLKSNEKKFLENQIKLRENELCIIMEYISTKEKHLSNALDEIGKFSVKSNEILKVKNIINSTLNSTSDLSKITDRMESQHITIAEQLKKTHPNLSTNDVKHCLLVKLQLSIKECSQHLNVSTHAVKIARQRVRKKMELPNATSLIEHLDTISNEIKV